MTRIKFNTTHGAIVSLRIVDTLEVSDFYGITPECAREILEGIHNGVYWLSDWDNDGVYEWQPSVASGIPFYLEERANMVQVED